MLNTEKKRPARQVIYTTIQGTDQIDPHTGLSRQKIIRRLVRRGLNLIPRLEPDHPDDPNAIGLWIEGRSLFKGKYRFHLGYLSAEISRDLAPLLREGITIKVLVLRKRGDEKKRRHHQVDIVISF